MRLESKIELNKSYEIRINILDTRAQVKEGRRR